MRNRYIYGTIGLALMLALVALSGHAAQTPPYGYAAGPVQFYCTGTAGEWARLNAALRAHAGRRTVRVAQGTSSTCLVDSVQSLPSHTDLEFAPGMVLRSTIPNTGPGGFASTVFFANATGIGDHVLLTADAKIGQNVISVASPVQVGSSVLLGFAATGNIEQQATVIASSGSGPYVLTLDEAVAFSYFTGANGAFVYPYTAPTNIRVRGNGLRVWGTGDRVAEFARSRFIYVDGIVVDHTLGPTTSAGFRNIQFSFDVGCRDVGFSNIVADGGNGYLTSSVATGGIASESTIRWSVRDSRARGIRSSPGLCVMALDTRHGMFSNVTSEDCTIGRYYSANEAEGTEGPRTVTDVGGATYGCDVGWQFEKGVQATVLSPTSIGDAASFVHIGTGIVRFLHVNAKARATGAYNFALAFGGAGGHTYLSGVVDLSTGAGTTTVADWGAGPSGGALHIDAFRTIGGNYGLYFEAGGAQVVTWGADVDMTSTGSNYKAGPGLASVTWKTTTTTSSAP